jgi:hypothetical protein
MQKGDVVRTIDGWSYKTWTGIIIERREGSAKVLWTEASQIDGQIFWAPIAKLEVINAKG